MKFDIAVIGAGPAGMAAIIEAQALGLKAVLLDEQPNVGGQIYRNIENPSLKNKAILGAEYYEGSTLVKQMKSNHYQHIARAMVWQIDADGTIYYSSNKTSKTVQARHILIASGAKERPTPIPGWTLPGVMTGGAAQVLLKSSGLAAENAVFAGSGPLLYLIVWQYLQAGIKVKAVLDTTPWGNYLRASTKFLNGLRGSRNVLKGLKMIYDIKSAGIPLITNVKEIKAQGNADTGIKSTQYRIRDKWKHFDTDHLFLHQGVIPNINLSMASQCEHEWNPVQLCWQPKLDEWGQSSQPHISIAGDTCNIGGAKAAQLRGAIAAHQIAHTLKKQTTKQRNERTYQYRKALNKELSFRPFIDTLYKPAEQFRVPQNEEVTICRCEEVKLRDIQLAIKQGCMGPNQLKSFTRCGMGSCQGRQCGQTVSEVMSKLTGKPVNDIGYYKIRAPIKPLTLNDIASLELTESDEECGHH